MRRIGILGGTFDPVHIAHLMIAEGASDEFSLDRTFLMPTGSSPHKEEAHLSPVESRAEMIQLAVSDNPRLSLSRFEMDFHEVSYTYRTAERLAEEYPEDQFYYIMGADSLKNFSIWRKPEVIARHFHLIAALRDNTEEDQLYQLSEQYRAEYGARVSVLHVPNFSISSTDIRNRVKNGRSIRYMTTDAVIAYIKEHHLYE